MSKQIAWNKHLVERFIEEAMLNEFEQKILITRAKGITRTEQSIMFNCSLATIDRTIKRLKIKYDKVQLLNKDLPTRKKSVEETYMDTH